MREKNIRRFFVWPGAYIKTVNSPPESRKSKRVCLFFRPIRFVPQIGFRTPHLPRNISAIQQKFCKFFPLFYLFFGISLCEYCLSIVSDAHIPLYYSLYHGYACIRYTHTFILQHFQSNTMNFW